MRPLLLFIAAFFLFNAPFEGFSQKTKVSLYGDVDINTLSPKKPIDSLQQLAKYQKYLGFAYDKKGTLDKLFLFENNSKGNRFGTILHKNYGTVIGFNVQKTDGYEKVLIFADKDYYHDSILLKGDTIAGKHLSDDYFEIILCGTIGDTIIVKSFTKSYRGQSGYPTSYPIHLSLYKQYFTTTLYDKSKTYRIIKTGNNYTVEWMESDSSKVPDYEKDIVTSRLKRYGPVPFWIVADDLVYVED